MALPLREPAGEPDVAAQRIIDAIEEYRTADRDPAVTVGGLRHIYYRAEHAWDEAVHDARLASPPTTWARLMEATGDHLGTLQGRARAHRRRTREKALTRRPPRQQVSA